MTKRSLIATALLAGSACVSCGGQFSEAAQTSPDGGATGGHSGSGGSATGGASDGGHPSSGGTSAGGVANTGGSQGGAAGGGDAGSVCPPTAPPVGSPCTSGLQCTYGSICCGGGYVCGPNGSWQNVAAGCGCARALPDAGPYPCGAVTCAPTEVCVHPADNFCGPQPLCVPALDGGACPTGTTWMQYCGGSSSGGCVAVPKPPPPFCAPMPSSCGGTPSCACLPSGICGPSGADVCTSTQGRDVSCLCVAP